MGLFEFIQSTLSAQSETYFEDLRSNFRIKSVCSGPYPVKLQVSPVVILELALILYKQFIFSNYRCEFLALQLASILLSWHCGKPSVSVSPTHSHQAAIRAPSHQPISMLNHSSSHSLFLSILCSCPDQPVSQCWAPASTSASLSSEEPQTGHSAPAAASPVPNHGEGLLPSAVPQWWAVFSWPLGPGYNLVVLPRHISNCSKSKTNCRNC